MTYLKPRITVMWGLIATHCFCFGWHFPAVCASASGKWWLIVGPVIWVVSSLLLCWPDEDIEHKLLMFLTHPPDQIVLGLLCQCLYALMHIDIISRMSNYTLSTTTAWKYVVGAYKWLVAQWKSDLEVFTYRKSLLVLVKILYCFGAKAIANLYRYFICMSQSLSDRDIHA